MTQPHIYYYVLHLFSSYFTFFYLRLPYVYRHAETGVGGFHGFHFWAWGWGLGASGFLPPTKDANEKSQEAKRFKRRSKVKESEHFLDLVVLLLLLGVGMTLLSLLRLLLFLLVGAAVTVLEKIERKGKR